MLCYIYNTKTNKLHIEGYCRHAKKTANLEYIRTFSSEDEAIRYDGRAVSVCKICERKRELLLNRNEPPE